MVWLICPKSQLSKTFFQIENQFNINEVYVICMDCVDIHSIEFINNTYDYC